METLFHRVAGLDIHKNTIVVCVRITDQRGQARESIRTFGTMTEDLLQLHDWMAEQGDEGLETELDALLHQGRYRGMTREAAFQAWKAKNAGRTKKRTKDNKRKNG